ncbi:hypothetical protein, partial [Paraburkholderia sp. BR14427]|uniref:hypothetical protein n=1 Tax=Paraburkholderia sp. BR14427 TaxID=3237008 RepID=UPI0034CD6730
MLLKKSLRGFLSSVARKSTSQIGPLSPSRPSAHDAVLRTSRAVNVSIPSAFHLSVLHLACYFR